MQPIPNKFAPHGEFTLAWRGNVLFVTYRNDWNREAVKALHTAAKAAWANPPQRPWAMFSDCRDWTGSSQEVFDEWWIFYQDAVANGMTTVTDVLPSALYEAMVKQLYSRAVTLANYRHCRSVEEAWSWLAEQGFGSEPLVKTMASTKV